MSSVPRPQMNLRMSMQGQESGVGVGGWAARDMLLLPPLLLLLLHVTSGLAPGAFIAVIHLHSQMSASQPIMQAAHPSAIAPEKGGCVQFWPGPSVGAGTTSMCAMVLHGRRTERMH